jgi:hypothetical protein
MRTDELHGRLKSAPLAMAYRPSTAATLAYTAQHAHQLRLRLPNWHWPASILEIWEASYAALRRTPLKRTREDEDDPPRHRNKSKQLSITPSGMTDSLPHLCGTWNLSMSRQLTTAVPLDTARLDYV